MNGSSPLAALLGLALLALGALPGCFPNNSSPPATRSPDGKSCGQRLVGGAWKFTGFSPDQPLDPQAALALERLHGSLRLSFDGQHAQTVGPAINHVGPYRVDSDDGLSCRIVAPDDTGLESFTLVRFLNSPDQIEVIDRRSSVPGRSTMQRVPFGV